MRVEAIVCQIDAVREYATRHLNVHGLTEAKLALAEALEAVMAEIERQNRLPRNAGDVA